MSKKIELVARALFKENCPGLDPDALYEGEPQWMLEQDAARVALEAVLKADDEAERQIALLEVANEEHRKLVEFWRAKAEAAEAERDRLRDALAKSKESNNG